MDAVFGADMTSPALTHDQQQSDFPSTYDTELFPGGISRTTQSRAQPTTHPLLQRVNLPPSNSIYQSTSHSPRSQNSSQGSNARAVSSYITGPGGNLIQIHNRLDVVEGPDPARNRNAPAGTLAGWADDGVAQLNDFSVTFGRAMNDFMEQTNAQNQAVVERNNDNPTSGGDDTEQNNEEAENNDEQAESDEVMNEAAESSTGDHPEPPPAAEPAETSSVSMQPLTISSQPESDSPTNDPLTSNEQSTNRANADDSADGNNDAMMEESQAVGANADQAVEAVGANADQAVADLDFSQILESAPPADQQAEEFLTEGQYLQHLRNSHSNSNEAAVEENVSAAPEEEENQNEAPGDDNDAVAPNVEDMAVDDSHNEEPSANDGNNDNEEPAEESNEAPAEDANNSTLTCPPDIDPEV